MVCELIAPVLYLRIEEKGFEFAYGVTLYRGGSHEVNSIFRFSKSLLSEIGTHAVEVIYQNSCFYWSLPLDQINAMHPVNSTFEAGHLMTSTIMFDVMCLWFEKDNSCFCNHGYLLSEGRRVSSVDNRDVFVSKSDGTYGEVLFSTAEFMRANEVSVLLSDLIGKDNIADTLKKSTGGTGAIIAGEHSHFKSNRIKRAFMMLMVARSTVEPAMKIAFYMNAFECLFTTDDTEVSNKVTQRITLFLGGTVERMLQVRDQLKQGYNIRSKFVHGAGSTKPLFQKENLVKASKEIDSLLRLVFLKVIHKESDKFLSDDKDLIKYFDSFIYRE